MRWVFVILFFAALSLAYFWPAPLFVFRYGQVVGPGHDEITLAYYYWLIPEIFKKAPWELFNGTLFSGQIGAPIGNRLWIPAMERVLTLAGAPFFTPEQLTLTFVLGLHVIAGSLMTWLGRRLGLNWILSLCMGVCLAFTPYTHWRSRVHLALAGVFALPLIPLGYSYLKGAKGRRELTMAATLFLCIASAAHYVVLVSLTILPIVFLFFWGQKRTWERFLRFSAVLIPLGMALIWIRLGAPIPTSQTEGPLFSAPLAEDRHRDWDVLVYSARPVDYLTGNFDSRAWDWNPLRKWLTNYVREHSQPFYPHERSSGVRWFLLVFATLAFFQRKSLTKEERHWVYFGLSVFAAGYLFSLSPRAIAPFGIGIAPSRWIHALIPEVRAPNRWSTAAHLGLLIAAFTWLQAWLARLSKRETRPRRRSTAVLRRALPRTVPFLVLAFSILDFPPLLAFPTQTPETPLNVEPGCGRGVFLPYRSNDDARTYRQIRRLRKTDCEIINAQQTPRVDRAFYFLLGQEGIFARSSDELAWTSARHLLECLGVQWVRLEPEVSGMGVCEKLGFSPTSLSECRREPQARRRSKLVECLVHLPLLMQNQFAP